MTSRAPVWRHVLALAIAVVAAYGADVGRGFIKEDAVWVMHNRVAAIDDVRRVFTQSGGFFRPIVGLSFALNHRMFGANPRGYGWTNLLLAAGAAVALWRLAEVLGLPRGAAIAAAGVWILNFHGINMAVLWLSGRTALLLVLFALLAAVATARDRPFAASLFAFLAMASKEEGVLLPFALIAVLLLRPQGAPARRVVLFAAAFCGVWAIYGALRMHSDAITPMNAPPFYTFAAPDWSLRKNLGEYADRSLTFPVVVAMLALAAAWRRVRLTRAEIEIAGLGGIWLVAGFALTILLPARSSLYAVFPSVGAALACAALVNAAWRAMPPARRRWLALAALILPFLLVPVYWQRNVRWTELADVSANVVRTFAELAQTAPEPWEVIVIDDRSTRANITAAVAITDAVELATGRRPRVWLVPPPDDLDKSEWAIAPPTAHAVLALRGGRIVRVPIEEWKPAAAADLR